MHAGLRGLAEQVCRLLQQQTVGAASKRSSSGPDGGLRGHFSRFQTLLHLSVGRRPPSLTPTSANITPHFRLFFLFPPHYFPVKEAEWLFPPDSKGVSLEGSGRAAMTQLWPSWGWRWMFSWKWGRSAGQLGDVTFESSDEEKQTTVLSFPRNLKKQTTNEGPSCSHRGLAGRIWDVLVCPDEVKFVFEEPRRNLVVKLPLKRKRRRGSSVTGALMK